MKKILALILVSIGITLSLIGCGKEEGPVTIIIWHDKEEAVAKVLQTRLDTLVPDIIVKLEKKEGLTDALKLVGNDPASAPDMYFFAHDKIGVYAEMGILAPITDFIEESTLDQYMDITMDAATYKGTLYQLPLYYETLLFMYNKAYMTEEEVPATTEELYVYMKENTKDGRFGFVEQHSTAYYSIPWINGFGGSLINGEGVPQLNTEQVEKALEYHLKFMEYMPGESEYSTVNTLFMEGYADSIIGGPWMVPSVRDAGIELGFAPMPIVDETDLPLTPYSGVQGIQVLKHAADTKKDAVSKVLNCLTEVEIGVEMASISGCAPANKLCYENDAIAEDAMIMMMKQTAENAIAMPNVPEMDVMFIVTGNMLVDINMKKTPIRESIDAFQKKAETLIDAMK